MSTEIGPQGIFVVSYISTDAELWSEMSRTKVSPSLRGRCNDAAQGFVSVSRSEMSIQEQPPEIMTTNDKVWSHTDSPIPGETLAADHQPPAKPSLQCDRTDITQLKFGRPRVNC